MPIRIYTKLDGFNGEDNNEGNGRDRVLLIEGETDESRIYTAVDDTTGATVPTLGSAHPVFAGLTLKSRTPRRIRLGLWEMGLRYSGVSIGGPTTPAVQGLRWKWEFGQTTENRDYDIYDKPLIDRAGFPIANGFPFTSSSLFLKVWRQETDFDVATAFSITRRVNKVRMSILGRWWVDPGQVMLWTYAPDEDQRANMESVRTMYVLEFREGLRPFQPKWPNAGFNNWATTGLAGLDGRICYANGDPVDTPVNFKLTGEIVNQASRQFRLKKRDGNIVSLVATGNPSITALFSTVTTLNGNHATPPGSDKRLTYQWAYEPSADPSKPHWKILAGTTAETQLISQNFYDETDLRGLIPGIL